MNQTKNLFFSEDEIEAVDMEIETLLLARARQESQQYPASIIDSPQPLQHYSETPFASGPSPISTRANANTTGNPASALPPRRLAKRDAYPAESNFRIIAAGEDAVLWPKAEPKKIRNPQVAAKRSFRFKWLIILAVSVVLWAAIIATSYTIWQSSSLLNVARFALSLFQMG